MASLLLASPAARAGAQANLSTENVKQAETEAGDLVADAVRAAGGADIAFVPAAAFKPGATVPRPASAEQAAGLMEPASDAVVVLSLRGTQVLAALERAVSFAPQSSSGFLQVSGLKFTYDASKPGGKRVVSATVGGAPLDAVKTYKVATTRPLANGQQGYFQIWDKDQISADPGKTLAAALADLARQRGGNLSASVEGRIAESGR
jgi:2',3'-cyclic-nucleotide 2'-phosphodiesterase (5'-nucleotidase family)